MLGIYALFLAIHYCEAINNSILFHQMDELKQTILKNMEEGYKIM